MCYTNTTVIALAISILGISRLLFCMRWMLTGMEHHFGEGEYLTGLSHSGKLTIATHTQARTYLMLASGAICLHDLTGAELFVCACSYIVMGVKGLL